MNRKPKRITIIIAGLIVAFISIQFIQQPVQNPPATHPIKAPAEVVEILQRACYNCHSNETNLAWYDKLAPASWLINADVKEACSRFNFSTWDTLPPADQQGRFWEMVNMVLTKKMPLSTYIALHPEAKLSQQDIAILEKYARDLSPAKYHDTTMINAAAHEQASASSKIPVAANGVAYMPDYKNWQVISTTNRFDNHSIRIIYANAIAAKAIQQNKISTFPEGSTIVKVVWNSIEENNGDILPGTVNSVQIMTKDNKRFAASEGWGFAKFNGAQLKPYGTTAVFNTTCFNCHKIADKNDFVFNLPKENK